MNAFTLRPYAASDEAATIELWRRTWQAAYPAIDFNARLAWWRERWRNELVPAATVIVATINPVIIGFVTVDANTGYVDQIVVAPEQWRGGVAAALLADAKRIAPNGIDLVVNQDNARAIRFYGKQGFVITGVDTNALSGAPLHKMSWRPAQTVATAARGAATP